MKNAAKRMASFSPDQWALLQKKLEQQDFDVLKLPVTRETGSREEENYFPLSFGQERLWFIQQLEPHSSAYNLLRATKLDGDLDIPALEKSIREIIRRHDILRTVFLFRSGKPVQVIRQDPWFPLEKTGITGTTNDEKEQQVRQIIHDLGQERFDLEKGPLLRMKLLKLNDREHVFLLVIHHIISDGTSVQVFIRELVQLYGALSQDRQSPLPDLEVQYVDYACWQRRWFGEQASRVVSRKKQEDYWLEQFSGELPILNLPLDYPRPQVRDFSGDIADFHLDERESSALKEMALQAHTTLFVVLLGVLNIFLSRLGGREDIVVGTPVAGRRHPDIRQLIGMFVNTLALRNYPRRDISFAAFLEELKKRTLAAFENQEYRYEDIVNKVNVKRDTSRNPLFDVMFMMRNVDYAEVSAPGLAIKHFEYESKTAKFDLTLNAWENHTLHFSFEYCTALFSAETIQRFIDYFKQAVRSIVGNPEILLSEIDILPQEEKQRILVEFNDTRRRYPGHKTIHQLFTDQVQRTPDRLAISGRAHEGVGDPSLLNNLTYRELNKKADQVAKALKEKGVVTENIVALKRERSIQLMIDLLGILKAGAAYLPIDPDYPQERIDYMLADSSAHILSTMPEKRLIHHSSTLAYVIYTSGSTGKPKGVMIEHRAAVNFIAGMTEIIDFRPGDRILSLTTICFDIFGLETLVPLTRGSTVIMGTENEQRDPEAALVTAARQQITIFQVTPSRLHLYLSYTRDDLVNYLSKLRYLLVGGEAFPGSLLKKARPLVKGKIINLYGPTETTIWSTAKDLSGDVPLTIGRPIINTGIYILDSHLKPVPIGVTGEIYIGGHGMARGYLNNPELTADKFFPGLNRSYRTHRTYIPKKLYRTGDLGRWLPSGEIQCLGRVDHQVKIRGYRIEVEEIENRLIRHDNIAEAVVIAREGDQGDRFLCAYYVPVKQNQDNDTGNSIEVSQLREFLARDLPEYMIPSYFVPLERIPLTANKKIDRKALLNHDMRSQRSSSDYLAPQGELEKKIADCWMEVLKLERVGVHDNFFDLGGNSFNVIQLKNLLTSALGREITVVSMFRCLTVSAFARHISEEEERAGAPPKTDRRQEGLRRARNVLKHTVKKRIR